MKNKLSAVILLPLSPAEIIKNHNVLPILKKAYFFRGNEYIRYDVNLDTALKGYPKTISQYWPGIWSDGIDAALEWANNKVYFFKGSQYIRYDMLKDKADSGYPMNISDSWPGIWSDGIDAVVSWPNGKVYFFKGKEYIRYDIATDKADPGYPKSISGNWRGLWSDGIDAAVLWPNGKAYFFKGNEYIRYDVKSDKADERYPAPIAGNWRGLIIPSIQILEKTGWMDPRNPNFTPKIIEVSGNGFSGNTNVKLSYGILMNPQNSAPQTTKFGDLTTIADETGKFSVEITSDSYTLNNYSRINVKATDCTTNEHADAELNK